jgi:choline monooxygenase
MKRLQCPYHYWTYDLDGRLLSAPHFNGYGRHLIPDGDSTDRGLIPVRTAQWHDWIFVNIDGKSEPLEDFVAPMAAKLADVEFGELRHFLTMQTRRIDANWKICLENTMEPYHVPFVHRKTAAGQPLQLHYTVDDGPVMGCAIDIDGSAYTNEPGGASIDNLDMSARYLLRVPNLFLTSYAPDIIIDTMYLPDSRDPAISWLQQAWYTTSGRILTPAEVEAWRDLEERVLEEDVGIMESVQQGVESVAVDDGGILSPAWETSIAAFYRNLVAELQSRE